MQTPVDPRVVILEAELARARAEFERVLATIPPSLVHRAPAPGVWTPAQVVWHVAKIERGIARTLQKQDTSLPPNTTVPPGPRSADVLGRLAGMPSRDRTKRVAAPEFAVPPDVVDYTEARTRLAEGRALLLGVLRDAGPRLTLLRFPHVYFGTLDGWQWAVAVIHHDDRHRDQLTEIAAQLG